MPPTLHEPSHFFLLRTPLLPLATLVTGPSTGGGSSRVERADERRWLRALWEQPEVREAIFLASPGFADVVTRELSREEADPEGRKVELAFYRYVARMTGRTTPFGTFAGISLGTVGAEPTRLELTSRSTYRRHARLDMSVLCDLMETLVQDPASRPLLRYRLNPTLHPIGGRYRYANLPLSSSGQAFPVVDLEGSPHLSFVMTTARQPVLWSSLVTAFTEAFRGLSPHHAEGFVASLVDNAVLVPALTPSVTGPEPLGPFVDELRTAPELEPLASALAGLDARLARLAEEPLGSAAERQRDIRSTLGALPGGKALDGRMHINLVKPAEQAQLGRPVVDELLRVAGLFSLFGMSAASSALNGFREQFERRYEQREVSLLEALDQDFGVGFRQTATADLPLLRGLPLQPARPSPDVDSLVSQLVGSRLAAPSGDGPWEIELREADLEPLRASSRGPTLDSFVVFCHLLGAGSERVDEDFWIFRPQVIGPSGLHVMARFGHADPAIEACLRQLAIDEERRARPAIIADIVHLPSGQLGNVLLRPSLRSHEICCHAVPSAMASEHTIPLEDLLVSVEGERFVLRSRRLGCRVIPRVTSAHNVQHDASSAAYTFLTAVGWQDSPRVSNWSWGSWASTERLPRVRSGRSILSPARWSLRGSSLEQLRAAAGRADAMARLSERWGLPRWVAIGTEEDPLPIDLHTPLGRETLGLAARASKRLIVEEWLGAEGSAPTRGPEGDFHTELVVPFVSRPRQETGQPVSGTSLPSPRPHLPEVNLSARPAPSSPEPLARRRPPGSEVLYVKLYGGVNLLDEVLLEGLAPLIEGIGEPISHWFFLRYRDPDAHLRLRLFGRPEVLTSRVLPAVRAQVEPWLATGALWRWQVDTYEREIERYGGPDGMRLAEAIFHADSVACLDALGLVRELGDDEHWQVIAFGIDQLLGDFGLSIDQRIAFCRDAVASFDQEFNAHTPSLRQALNERVRSSRAFLERLVSSQPDPLREPWVARSRHLAPLAAALAEGVRTSAVSTPLQALVWDLVHLHVNRMAADSPRAHELVLYHLLLRGYEIQRGRRGERP